ncbi:hypothetical protein C8R45DRAFT_1212958 [Mycena sanguinolenta]|nr:hypothetical protein C8R45DRAFT_1212958 [Mycena sanguinolenta]
MRLFRSTWRCNSRGRRRGSSRRRRIWTVMLRSSVSRCGVRFAGGKAASMITTKTSSSSWRRRIRKGIVLRDVVFSSPRRSAAVDPEVTRGARGGAEQMPHDPTRFRSWTSQRERGNYRRRRQRAGGIAFGAGFAHGGGAR